MTKEELKRLEEFFRRAIDNQFYLEDTSRQFLKEILQQIREEIDKKAI